MQPNHRKKETHMSKAFKGILAALVTPYTDDNKVDLPGVKKLVRYLMDRGIDGFYVCGTTGEAFLLTPDERKAILDAVLEESAGEKQVIAHVGNISTDFAIDLAKHAERAGADAVSAISPFYYKFTLDEIKGYYQDIMNSINTPLFIYNFPNASGFNLTPEVLSDLCEKGNVAGVKFTSNNFHDLALMKKAHPELTIWNGFDEMFLSGLVAGADGAIGSTYNVLATAAIHVYQSFLQGDLAQAQHYQNIINQMVNISKRHNNLKVVRRILDLEGVHCGPCRAPFRPLPESAMDDVRFILEHYVRIH